MVACVLACRSPTTEANNKKPAPTATGGGSPAKTEMFVEHFARTLAMREAV